MQLLHLLDPLTTLFKKIKLSLQEIYMRHCFINYMRNYFNYITKQILRILIREQQSLNNRAKNRA